MSSLLQSLPKTIHTSIVLSIILFLGLFFSGEMAFDQIFWSWLFRYFHVLSGVMWIGLLWYLNFVQIPSMPKFTDEQKPAITKIIAEGNPEKISLISDSYTGNFLKNIINTKFKKTA